jgi:hypothetical protein
MEMDNKKSRPIMRKLVHAISAVLKFVSEAHTEILNGIGIRSASKGQHISLGSKYPDLHITIGARLPRRNGWSAALQREARTREHG